MRVRGAVPQLVGDGLPLLGEAVAAGAERFGALGCDEVGGARARVGDYLTQTLRILQHRAGSEVIVVKRLISVICLEQGTFQPLDKRILPDISLKHI